MTDRYEPPEFDDLVDDDVPDELRAELERVDALLRSVPALPELPPRLRDVSLPVERQHTLRFTFGRAALGLATAAAVALGFFALGSWLGNDDFDAQAAIPMEATKNAEGAAATISLGPLDTDGNRTVRLDASGLPALPDGGYYFLWLAKDGDYAAPCGTFAVGAGDTSAEWTVSYDLESYDEWVVTARMPDADNAEAPWLLQASIATS